MMEWLQRGGPVMWVLAVISVLALGVFLRRLFDLHRAQIKTGDFLSGIFTVISRGNVVEAVSLCEETPGPVAQIVRAAILERKNGRERIQQVMGEVGLAEIPRLEKNLIMLLTLAQLAPMCGLLGTVLGMMEMFGAIQDKAPLVHAGDLGAGIWQALICTAAGLVIAIPAYAGYNLLVGRVEAILLDMERAFAEVLVYFSGGEAAGEGKP
jgi:biopolymer transport protein ExbB